ncbi:MAG: heme NO-binding domain-containing protein [Kofleriaceae bacterium]
MKGIIFNLLEEFVQRELGADAWDAVLASAGSEGVYTSLGNYPDAELSALVGEISARLGQSDEDTLRAFGAAALQRLAERYPVFFRGHQSIQSFLPTLNDVIHKEVRKIYAGAEAPDFGYAHASEGHFVLTYSSARGLCALAEGFIHGAAAFYEEAAALQQLECMHRGDARCVFDISFRKRAS